MTQSQNRIFDEMARLMSDAASVAQGVRREAETAFRTQVERFVADLDLVKREDFDVVREMASRARQENEDLRKRVATLEAALAASSPGVGSDAAGATTDAATSAGKPRRARAPRAAKKT